MRAIRVIESEIKQIVVDKPENTEQLRMLRREWRRAVDAGMKSKEICANYFNGCEQPLGVPLRVDRAHGGFCSEQCYRQFVEEQSVDLCDLLEGHDFGDNY